MATGNLTKRSFYSVRGGKIFKSCDASTPNAVQYVNKNNETKYGLMFDYIEGFIAKLSTKKVPFNGVDEDFFVIEFKDESGEVESLEFKLDSNFFRNFAFCFPNMDLTYPVRLAPYQTEKDGKKKSGFYVSQNNEKVEWFYTREDSKGLPEWFAVKNKKGEIVDWDKSDQTEFLLAEMEKKMKAGILASTTRGDEDSAPSSENNSAATDDLPF